MAAGAAIFTRKLMCPAGAAADASMGTLWLVLALLVKWQRWVGLLQLQHCCRQRLCARLRLRLVCLPIGTCLLVR